MDYIQVFLLITVIVGELIIISRLDDIYKKVEQGIVENANILTKVEQVLGKGVTVMATLEELRLQVQETTNIEQSAILLIQGLAQKIQDLINQGADPAAYQELVDQLNASEQALAAAVQANTPIVP